MTARLTRFITTLSSSPSLRVAALAGYYVAVAAAVFALATLGAFVTPSFVYQGF